MFYIFLVHGKNGLRWPQIGPGGFFPTNPDLADILGRTDLDFDNLYFYFLDLTFLDFRVPRIPKFGLSQACAFYPRHHFEVLDIVQPETCQPKYV